MRKCLRCGFTYETQLELLNHLEDKHIEEIKEFGESIKKAEESMMIIFNKILQELLDAGFIIVKNVETWFEENKEAFDKINQIIKESQDEKAS